MAQKQYRKELWSNTSENAGMSSEIQVRIL